MDSLKMHSAADSAVDDVVKRLEVGRLLPWRMVTFSTWVDLANKLDIVSPVLNNDWHKLAELLKFSTEAILGFCVGFNKLISSFYTKNALSTPFKLLPSCHSSTWSHAACSTSISRIVSSNSVTTSGTTILETVSDRKTIALFKTYLSRRNSSVNEVVRALKRMDRQDALTILLDAVPDIEEQYEEMISWSDADNNLPADQACYRLPFTAGHSMQHRFHHHLDAHQFGRHPVSSRCSRQTVGGGDGCPKSGDHGIMPSGIVTADGHSWAGGVCRAHDLQTYQAGRLPASDLVGCHAMFGGGPDDLPVNSARVPAYDSVLVERNLQDVLESEFDLSPSVEDHFSNVAGFNGPNEPFLDIGLISHSMNNHLNLPSEQPFASLSDGMGFTVAEYQPLCGDLGSVEGLPFTQSDVERFHGSGLKILDDLHPTCSVDMLFEDAGIIHDAAVIQRATVSNELESSGLFHDHELFGIGSMVTEITASTGVGHVMSPVGPAMASPFSAVSQQSPYTDYDCGTLLSSFPAGGAGSALCTFAADSLLPVTSVTHDWPGVTDRVSGGIAVSGDVVSAPLKQMEQLSHIPTHFQPTSDYTMIVAEQKIEESVRDVNGEWPGPCHKGPAKRWRCSDLGALGPGTPHGTIANPCLTTMSPLTLQTSVDAVCLKSKRRSPLGVTDEDATSCQAEQQIRSTPFRDVPIDRHRTAFCHIKVFVTYTTERSNSYHNQLVLSLCSCLFKNGFSCCADEGTCCGHLSEVNNTYAKFDWQLKYKEADFVLVCLSTLYLEIIQSALNKSSPVEWPPEAMHGPAICQLMFYELSGTGSHARIILLVMDGSSSLKKAVPPWLKSQLSYFWPGQYKDLLWTLTKPEDRIKQRSTALNGMKTPGGV